MRIRMIITTLMLMVSMGIDAQIRFGYQTDSAKIAEYRERIGIDMTVPDFETKKIDAKVMGPRLLLSDNMEDKGLEVERGINFQKTVVSRLQEVNEQTYQVIFATSFIDDELNKPEYTVGDFYTQRNKSLKNV